jgi:hypothetical protein
VLVGSQKYGLDPRSGKKLIQQPPQCCGLDADPDSDFYFDVDPNADPDSTFHPDVDPDLDPSFQKKAHTFKKVLIACPLCPRIHRARLRTGYRYGTYLSILPEETGHRYLLADECRC